MDEKFEILLNEEKNIDSINEDSFGKIELSNKPALINEYDIKNVLSVTELFELEREENQVYRIYGRFEYLSLLNGLRNNYEYFRDFFNPVWSDGHRRRGSQMTTPVINKNIFNSFDFYLVRPADSDYIQHTTDPTRYFRPFKVIASVNNIEIYKAGFAVNVFDEQTYAFHFNIDFDVSDYRDYFGFPLTELYLFVQYKPSGDEIIQHRRFSNTGVMTNVVYTPITLNIGDFVESNFGNKIGDYIIYSKPNFTQTQQFPQEIRIRTPILFSEENPSNVTIQWKYNPFIPLKLRYFDNNLSKANTGDTSYETTTSIPDYATNLGNGNFVWREILPQGYIDPLTGIGVNYPFVNKKRYLFDSIVLDIVPDLTHAPTLNIFQTLWFDNETSLINARPIGDINNIGKPCL